MNCASCGKYISSEVVVGKGSDDKLQRNENGCEYTQIGDDCNAWQCSKCGRIWKLSEGCPKENDMKYCPRCGLSIIAQWRHCERSEKAKPEIPKSTPLPAIRCKRFRARGAGKGSCKVRSPYTDLKDFRVGGTD